MSIFITCPCGSLPDVHPLALDDLPDVVVDHDESQSAGHGEESSGAGLDDGELDDGEPEDEGGRDAQVEHGSGQPRQHQGRFPCQQSSEEEARDEQVKGGDGEASLQDRGQQVLVGVQDTGVDPGKKM